MPVIEGTRYQLKCNKCQETLRSGYYDEVVWFHSLEEMVLEAGQQNWDVGCSDESGLGEWFVRCCRHREVVGNLSFLPRRDILSGKGLINV